MRRLESPPSNACEDEVGDDATGDEGAATKVAVVQQILHPNCVKEDVYGGKKNVEENQIDWRCDFRKNLE